MHPFHPLAGRQLRRVGERANMFGRRVLCLADDGTVWALPIEWTDLVEPAVEQEIAAGRAYVLIENLLALAELVSWSRRP